MPRKLGSQEARLRLVPQSWSKVKVLEVETSLYVVYRKDAVSRFTS